MFKFWWSLVAFVLLCVFVFALLNCPNGCQVSDRHWWWLFADDTSLFFLSLELVCFFGCALNAVLSDILCTDEVLIFRKISLHSKAKEKFDRCIKCPESNYIREVVDLVLDRRILAVEALFGLAMLVFLTTRLLLSLSVVALGLIWIQQDELVFKNVASSGDSFNLFLKVIYLTLVTISTVGFGDMAPNGESGAAILLGFVTILSASVFLLIIFNVWVSWAFRFRNETWGLLPLLWNR